MGVAMIFLRWAVLHFDKQHGLAPCIICRRGGMADAVDSKSTARKGV